MKGTFASHTFRSKTFASGTWRGAGAVVPCEACCGTDMLAAGLSWLTDQLKAHVAQPVVYQRGAAQVALCATFGRTLLKLDDGFGGVRMEWTDRDFLIPAASLVLSGNAALPKRGDLIHEKRGNTTYVFEVMAPGKEPPWRWLDPFRKMLRIHAKQVATEGN